MVKYERVKIKRPLIAALTAVMVLTGFTLMPAAAQLTNPGSDAGTVYGAAKKVKAVFNANGGKIGSKTKLKKNIVKGKKLGKLPTAKRAGYTLKGWYTKKSGGKKISKNTKIKKNTTYYARWRVKPQTQDFILNAEVLSNYYESYGGLKNKYGDKLSSPEFIYHAEYSVNIAGKQPYYVFAGSDDRGTWEISNSDRCVRVDGPLSSVVDYTGAGEWKKPMKIEDFVKRLNSVGYPASYQVKQGQPTSYYVSEDDYAEVIFSGDTGSGGEGSGFGGRLRIELEANGTVSPSSRTWFDIIAG